MAAKLIFTLLAGFIGGLVFYRLKVPAGMLVGSIIVVSVLSVATPLAYMAPNAKLCAQIITGAYIGSTIKKSDIMHLPKIIWPYITVMLMFFALNMLMGFLIYFITPLDLLTSLLCAMPGGISDTPLIAMDMGADAAKVALMQFVRMVFGIGALPLMIVFVDGLAEKHAKKPETVKDDEAAASAPEKKSEKQKRPALPLLITLAVAIVGGVIGKKIGMPAGALVISMLAVLCLKMTYQKAYLPLWFRRAAQVLSGCCIGVRMTYQDVLDLRFMMVPAVLLIVGYLVNCVVSGLLLNRLFGLTRREGMLSASPAGATEMALIAADLGVTSPDLIVLQIGRLIGVMSVFPQVFSVIISAFG